jgi:hypothetical protein
MNGLVGLDQGLAVKRLRGRLAQPHPDRLETASVAWRGRAGRRAGGRAGAGGHAGVYLIHFCSEDLINFSGEFMHVPSKVPKYSPIRSYSFRRRNVPTLKTFLRFLKIGCSEAHLGVRPRGYLRICWDMIGYERIC